MGITNARLTVFFEEPFYIALYERTQDGYTQVCRVVFGKEPTDAEIYEYFLENWPRLKFSPPFLRVLFWTYAKTRSVSKGKSTGSFQVKWQPVQNRSRP